MDPTDDRAAAFTRLWTKHQPRIFAYIHALVPNWGDAEEVLQEAGVVLWQKFDRFDPTTNFSRWGCGVAYYEVLKHRERAAVSRRRFSDAFLALLAERTADMIETVPSLQEAMDHCMERLSPTDRQLIAMRYAAEATTDGIAAELQRSPDGVRKSLRRIHRALFDCVEAWRRQQEHP
jgi:RNA polymerase sigma-70 factor, ECF subfamily